MRLIIERGIDLMLRLTFEFPRLHDKPFESDGPVVVNSRGWLILEEEDVAECVQELSEEQPPGGSHTAHLVGRLSTEIERFELAKIVSHLQTAARMAKMDQKPFYLDIEL